MGEANVAALNGQSSGRGVTPTKKSKTRCDNPADDAQTLNDLSFRSPLLAKPSAATLQSGRTRLKANECVILSP
jgi:hypothetical protein